MLKRWGLVTLFIALWAAPGVAQDTPKAEVFLGGSWIHSSGQNFRGWNASVAGNLNDWFGIVGDFSGNYLPLANANIYTYTFGPRFTYRKLDRVAPFFHTLVGGARVNVSGAGSDSSFAANIGGGIDIKVTNVFAVRPIQVDALMTRFGPDTRWDARLSFGVVLRF